jgi:hypothetical protein
MSFCDFNKSLAKDLATANEETTSSVEGVCVPEVEERGDWAGRMQVGVAIHPPGALTASAENIAGVAFHTI